MVEETAGSLVHDRIPVNVFDCRYKKPSEKPHERASRLTMSRIIAT
jgi:hypothetical protein